MRREIIPGETVIFNVMGGMDTLMGPAAGAAFFPLRKVFSRVFYESYLIPVRIISPAW
jgi:ABC-type branched-subunit amino acid transport system permease subunit